MDKPLVTVGVASYNNSRFITATLESIINQTYENVELIIVDDCSVDDSVEVIQNWIRHSGSSVKFTANKKNVGITGVANILLSQSSESAKYFALIGSDDIMEEERIAKQVNCLEANDPNVAFVFSDMTLINENGDKIGDSYFTSIYESLETVTELRKKKKLDKLAYLINKHVFPAPSVLYKKSALLAMNGWDESLYFEDWDMNLRLINQGFDFSPSAEKLTQYRIVSTSLGRKPSPAYRESYLALISKYKGLSASIDSIINSKIINLAEIIYEENGQRSYKWLFKKLMIKPHLKLFVLTFFSLLGVEKKYLKRINIKGLDK